jgi:hypothetical protein
MSRNNSPREKKQMQTSELPPCGRRSGFKNPSQVLWSKDGQMIVKSWSEAGQKLVKSLSKSGQNPVFRVKIG